MINLRHYRHRQLEYPVFRGMKGTRTIASQVLTISMLFISNALSAGAASLELLPNQSNLPDQIKEADPPTGVFSGNVGLYSQYVARGVTYTRERPAVQAGIQYDHSSGWYLGFWATNVDGHSINQGSMETDPYGGFVGTLGEVAYDIGFWHWTFPNASVPNSRVSYDTLEVYYGLTYKNFNVRQWHEISDYFGVEAKSAVSDFGLVPNGNSHGSNYTEMNYSSDLSHGFTLTLHAARQIVHHYERLNFNDYRIALEKDLGNSIVVNLAHTETTANSVLYTDPRGLDTARPKWITFIRKSF